MIGRIVGNYKILQALGEGGVGMVYKGVDTMLDREVAIKVLRPELASQTAVVERFRSEAVTLAKLSHPNIATLYSLFRDGQDLLMVLEFLKGETLDYTLYRRGKISTDEAIPIFCQALEGINYAHNLGIVHRDIKPGNMMLTDEGIVKVLDFGIARLLGSARMTRVGNVIGTLEYMSPEQVKGHETDARSDVYGLGIMLYEMLTGKLPFESENDFALMKMQTENMPAPPSQLSSDIPTEVENAVMKSIAKDPNQRFQSAGEFLEYFLECGFALQTGSFGFNSVYSKRLSRPSKTGIKSGETSSQETLQLGNVQNEATLQLPPNEATLKFGNPQGEKTLPFGNVQNEVTLPIINAPTAPIPVPQSQIKTSPLIPSSEIPLVSEMKNEGISEKGVVSKPEVKGTRLATPVSNPVSSGLKATRLGGNEPVSTPVNNEETSPSFLSKLNWMHYTGAGVIGLFIFTLIGVAAVLPFVWNGGETPAVEQKPLSNPADSGTAPTPVNQPVAKEPNRNDIEINPPTPSGSTPISNTNPNPIGNSSTASNTVSSPPTSKRPNESETAKTSPAIKQPPKQKTPRNNGSAVSNAAPQAPSDKGSKGRARDILTEN